MIAISGLVFTVFGSLVVISVVQSSDHVDISSEAIYKEGKWIGNVVCHFYQQSDCELSMHERGRRIDKSTTNSRENLFYSCYSSPMSIALSISNCTYEDIQDYSCLHDVTQLYNQAWLTAYPCIEFEGNQSVGNVVSLTCNSVPGAPLYWILPGTQQDNNDVQIVDTSNAINSSTTAIIRLEDTDDGAEYKCCVQTKVGQYPIPCTSYVFNVDGSDSYSVELSAYYYNFFDMTKMIMVCFLHSFDTAFDPAKVLWYYCHQAVDKNCITKSSIYYKTEIDYKTNILTTTLNVTDDPYYPYWRCSYDGQIYYNFTVRLGTGYSPPDVRYSWPGREKWLYYSTDGYAAMFACTLGGNSESEITWTRKNISSFANGSEIITSGGSYTIEKHASFPYQWETKLTIFPFDATIHNAYYTCTQRNPYRHLSFTQSLYSDGLYNFNLNVVFNEKTSNGTNAIRVLCTFNAYPYPPNYAVDVVTAETVYVNTTLSSYEGLHMLASVTVDFQANLSAFPVTVRCTAFNIFDKYQPTFGELFINKTTPSTTST